MEALMAALMGIMKSAWTLLVGMSITLRELLSPPVTVQYPDRRPHLSPLFRGHPVLLSTEEGKLKCTACMACARACPVDAISIEGVRGEDRKMYPKSWFLNMGRCLQCNLCVEACPFDALGMSPRFETAVDSPEGLIYDLPTLQELGRTLPYSRVLVGTRLNQAPAGDAPASAVPASAAPSDAPASATTSGSKKEGEAG
ncbi:MAG TPA: NADH-quinone oxidoreductase subunit I [Firmicutes bacterium]|nr:NADH-quinone oxidoreductase subunit I [Bacillota bacterium]